MPIHFLYLRYKDNIYGYVLSILRDAHEAEDATQTVFMKLISVIRNYEPRQVPFTAWILRVAHNVAVDSLRQRRPVPCEEVIESSRAADDSSHEARRGLEQALETLSEDQREVVVLRNLVGLSPAEIADRMGRTEVLDPRAPSPRAPGHAPRAHPGRLRPNHPRRQTRRPRRTRIRNAAGAGPLHRLRDRSNTSHLADGRVQAVDRVVASNRPEESIGDDRAASGAIVIGP